MARALATGTIRHSDTTDCTDGHRQPRIALSRLVAQQRAMDVTADNIANANTPGFKAERVLFSDWLSRQSGTHGAAGGRTIAFTQDRATWRDQRARHAQPHRQSARPRDHRRRLLHRRHAARAAPDARRPLRPDAQRHRRRRSGNALLDTNGKPIQLAPDRHPDHHRRRRHDLPARTARLGKIGVVQPRPTPCRSPAEGGTLFRAAGRRPAAGRDAGAGAGRGRGFQRAAGAGDSRG